MNKFADFLYALRKEKGMTQAELADALGVTNKAVSKWETGEAMPETSLLKPIAHIFDVSVDELLEGRRADEHVRETNDDPKQHLFTRGKDDEETLADKICGAICATVVLTGIAVYLLLGTFAGLWHPHWVIIPVCALSCGLIGSVFELCNRQKALKRAAEGKSPYVGPLCGIIILGCIIAYLLIGAFAGLWHPYWLIIVGGIVFDGVWGSIDKVVTHRTPDPDDE